MARRARAFSLVEMLVVVAIVAVLTAVLTPALSRARMQSRGVLCRGNLRQLVVAAGVYVQDHDGCYPQAYDYILQDDQAILRAWDFTAYKDHSTGAVRIVPGMLWQGETIEKVQQCPSFRNRGNWLSDPYTGYNYNTSYVGHGSGEVIRQPARVWDVIQPGQCALFGDGGYAEGANKFMRSPWPCEGDQFFGRSAGTQSYRHVGRTNVAYCDGHVVAVRERYTETDPAEQVNITEDTGFLSPDNRAYDLR